MAARPWSRQAHWVLVWLAPIDWSEFSRHEMPREKARRAYERSRVQAKINGGAAKLLRNGKRVASYSYFAENE